MNGEVCSMKFQAIVAPTITELFERQIQDMILSGQVHPGDKLPTEAELAETMRVSKSAVHAGVKNLERMGFLRIVPRHGIYVEDYIANGNVDTLIALLKFYNGRLDNDTTISLLEARSALEGLAMRRFIGRRTEEDIAALEKIIAELRSAERREPPLSAAEIAEIPCAFHSYICAKSGNSVVPLIVNGFHDINIALWTAWIKQVRISEAADVLEDFLYYIKVRDVDSATALFSQSARDFTARLT